MYQPLREDVLSASPVHPERRRAGTHKPGVAAVRRAEEADYVGSAKPLLSWRDMHDLQRELQRRHEPGDLFPSAGRGDSRASARRPHLGHLGQRRRQRGSDRSEVIRKDSLPVHEHAGSCVAECRSCSVGPLTPRGRLASSSVFRGIFSLVCMLNYAHILEKQLAATSATPSRHTVLPSNPVRPAPLFRNDDEAADKC